MKNIDGYLLLNEVNCTGYGNVFSHVIYCGKTSSWNSVDQRVWLEFPHRHTSRFEMGVVSGSGRDNG